MNTQHQLKQNHPETQEDLNRIFCLRPLGKNIVEPQRLEAVKGSYIYNQIPSIQRIYYVQEGSVFVGNTTENGQEIVREVVRQGEIFGEMGLLSIDTPNAFAKVVSRTAVISSLPLDLFQEYMNQVPSVSAYIFRLIAQRRMAAETMIESLMNKSSRARVVLYLIEQTELRGERVGFEWVVRELWNHSEIGALTATSRQTVTTVLNELKKRNILTFDRRRLLIRDLEKLKKEVY